MLTTKLIKAIVFVFVSTQFVSSDLPPSGSATLDNLRLDRYDINERPQQNQEAIRVNVSIYAQDLEWRRNEMVMVLFFTQKWHDDRLTFTSDQPVLVQTEQLRNRIWLPDTFIIEATLKNVLQHGTIKVNQNGNVHWVQMIEIRVPCTLSFQEAWQSDGIVNCTINMESYGFTTQGITYAWIDRNPVVVIEETFVKPSAKFTAWKKTVKTINTGANSYGRLSVTFQFQTAFTVDVLNFMGTKTMQHFHA